LAQKTAPTSACLRGLDLDRARLDRMNTNHARNGPSERRPNGLEMSRPASQGLVSR